MVRSLLVDVAGEQRTKKEREDEDASAMERAEEEARKAKIAAGGADGAAWAKHYQANFDAVQKEVEEEPLIEVEARRLRKVKAIMFSMVWEEAKRMTLDGSLPLLLWEEALGGGEGENAKEEEDGEEEDGEEEDDGEEEEEEEEEEMATSGLGAAFAVSVTGAFGAGESAGGGGAGLVAIERGEATAEPKEPLWMASALDGGNSAVDAADAADAVDAADASNFEDGDASAGAKEAADGKAAEAKSAEAKVAESKEAKAKHREADPTLKEAPPAGAPAAEPAPTFQWKTGRAVTNPNAKKHEEVVVKAKVKGKKAHYTVEDEVEANFMGKGKWYRGRISRKHIDDGLLVSVDVAYDDGDKDLKLDLDWVRHLKDSYGLDGAGSSSSSSDSDSDEEGEKKPAKPVKLREKPKKSAEVLEKEKDMQALEEKDALSRLETVLEPMVASLVHGHSACTVSSIAPQKVSLKVSVGGGNDFDSSAASSDATREPDQADFSAVLTSMDPAASLAWRSRHAADVSCRLHPELMSVRDPRMSALNKKLVLAILDPYGQQERHEEAELVAKAVSARRRAEWKQVRYAQRAGLSPVPLELGNWAAGPGQGTGFAGQGFAGQQLGGQQLGGQLQLEREPGQGLGPMAFAERTKELLWGRRPVAQPLVYFFPQHAMQEYLTSLELMERMVEGPKQMLDGKTEDQVSALLIDCE
jgi:hypothetical protein